MKKRIVSVCMGMLLLTTVLGCGGKSSVLEGEQGTGTDTVNGSSKTESSTEQQMQVVDNSEAEITAVENKTEADAAMKSETGNYVTVEELCALVQPVIEQAAQDLIVDGKEGSSENVIKEVPGSFADVSGAVSRDGVNTLVEDILNAGIISGADKSYKKGELHYIVSVSDQGHNFKSDVFHYEKNTADIIRMNLRVAVDQWADIPEAEATGTDSLQRNMSAIYTVSFALNQGEWKILDFEAPTGEPEKLSASLLTDNVTIDYNEISSKFTGVYVAQGEDASKEDADILYLYAYGDSLDGKENSLFLSQNKGDAFNYESIVAYNNNKVIFARRNPQNGEITMEYVDKDKIIYNGTTYVRDTSYDSEQ